jgi:hypothetical protein
MPRTISRAEMNRRWRLNDPPPVRSGKLQAANEAGGASCALTRTPPAQPAALPAAIGSVRVELTRQIRGPDPVGITPGGSDHSRCAPADTCEGYVAPRSGAASSDLGPTTSTSEAAPRYNQPDAPGNGEEGVGYRNATVRSVIPLWVLMLP